MAIRQRDLGLLAQPKRVAFKATMNHGVLHVPHQCREFFSSETRAKINQAANTAHDVGSTADSLAGKSVADNKPRYSFRHVSV